MQPTRVQENRESAYVGKNGSRVKEILGNLRRLKRKDIEKRTLQARLLGSRLEEMTIST